MSSLSVSEGQIVFLLLIFRTSLHDVLLVLRRLADDLEGRNTQRSGDARRYKNTLNERLFYLPSFHHTLIQRVDSYCSQPIKDNWMVVNQLQDQLKRVGASVFFHVL